LKSKDWLTQPGGLANRLHGMRRAAGLTGSELARRLGWTRTKVPKIENGDQMPTRDDIANWVRACGQPNATADELIAMLVQGHTLRRDWKHELNRGHDTIQADWQALERQVRHYRNVQTLHIPGLLQTPDYARYRALDAVANYGANPEGVDGAVAARMARQQVLYEAGRSFEFVTTEAALRIGAAPPAVMIGQADRLAMMAQLPNITLGIIPQGVALPLLPQNSFVILDDRVLVETYTGETAILGGEQTETFNRFAEALMAEAVTDADARALCVSVGQWWQGL
jgi:transcriptional regulator with XRE-family HTH domain